MIIIQHRINTATKLSRIPKKYGVEVDIRSNNEKLIVGHEAFENIEFFENWIKDFNHRFLIANIKEEGIEKKVIKILNQKKIKNYFLLDVTIPQIIKLQKKNKMNFAIRLSKYESHQGIINFKFLHKWIWIDTFDSKIPFSNKILKNFKLENYKLCLVSPELGNPNIDLNKFINLNKSSISYFDAVCSKKTDIWFENI